jgi:hypothetical protein
MTAALWLITFLGCTFITIYPPGGGQPAQCMQCCTGGMCTIMCRSGQSMPADTYVSDYE